MEDSEKEEEIETVLVSVEEAEMVCEKLFDEDKEVVIDCEFEEETVLDIENV